MGIGQNNVAGIQADRVIELPPIGGDHVGRNLKLRSILEFSHDFTSRETRLRATGILDIGDNIMHSLAQFHSFAEAPCAIGVDVYPCRRESFFQCPQSLHFFLTGENATLQFEIVKAIFLLQCLCLLYDSLGSQDFLTPQAEPRVRADPFVQILHLSRRHFVFIRNIKQIAQHLHLFALLAFTQQLTHGNAQILSQQIQHRTFNRPLTFNDKF